MLSGVGAIETVDSSHSMYESVLLSHSRWLTWLASPSLAWRGPREGVAKRPYSVSRAMANPKTQWPKSSAAMPFVAPAESRCYRSWIS